MSQMPQPSPEREDARDPFDAELQALKLENRQHRQALDGIVGEIHARLAESPRQRLATDLLMTLASEDLAMADDGSWRDLPEMAEKCLEAAEKIYPVLDQPLKARTVISGETDGIPFRAHFDGEPSAEQRAALDDLVRAVHADMVKKPGRSVEEEGL